MKNYFRYIIIALLTTLFLCGCGDVEISYDDPPTGYATVKTETPAVKTEGAEKQAEEGGTEVVSSEDSGNSEEAGDAAKGASEAEMAKTADTEETEGLAEEPQEAEEAASELKEAETNETPAADCRAEDGQKDPGVAGKTSGSANKAAAATNKVTFPQKQYKLLEPGIRDPL